MSQTPELRLIPTQNAATAILNIDFPKVTWRQLWRLFRGASFNLEYSVSIRRSEQGTIALYSTFSRVQLGPSDFY
jgi:hypothetical protein